MSNVDEKLDHFSEAILSKAAKEKKEILDRAYNKRNKLLDEKELEFLEEAYNRIQEGLRKIKKHKNEIISRSIMDSKRELLNIREEITNKVFKQVEERLAKYTETPEYEDYLIKLIESYIEKINSDEYKIIISSTDKSKEELLSSKFNNVVVSDDDFIGGCVVQNVSHNMFYNDTFKDKLYSQRQEFIRNSGLQI